MTLLTAHSDTLLFGRQECRYWKLVADEDDRAQGHRAPYQVLANENRLGLAGDAAEQLKTNVASHHAHSHAGRLAMAYRVELGPGGKTYFSGHFDAAKLDGYRAELQQRIGLCRWAEEVMNKLIGTARQLPKELQKVGNLRPSGRRHSL